MTPSELTEVLAIARAAGREAGELVAAGFRKRTTVEHKGVVDLVTAYDRESETLLRERLAPIGIPIVGEEQGGTRPQAGLALYVDPLDGTTNFVHGHPYWCVSIGLADGALPILGVVTAPALGIEWWGTAPADGPGVAMRTSGGVDDPCVPSDEADLGQALLATGFPYDRRTSSDDNLEAFAALLKQAQGLRRCGAAAIDLCSVADGTYEGYWERKLNPWDLTGGSALVRGAGGRVTDPEGGDRFLATGHVVATNGRVHAALLAALARLRQRA